jgi:hypothetical protein
MQQEDGGLQGFGPFSLHVPCLLCVCACGLGLGPRYSGLT